MTTSEYLGLRLPDPEDYYSLENHWNYNSEKIDQYAASLTGASGVVTLLQVAVNDLSSTTLKPTGDTTDRAAAILAVLTAHGECHLTEGTYYVSGFEMPEGTVLTGAGEKTVLKLMSSVTSGYCVRIHRYNTVSGLKFSGGDSAPANITTDGAAIGTRHGIYLAANADGSGTARSGALMNVITGCWFEYFDGAGFFAENTGGGLFNSLQMDNCNFFKCMCGIDMNYYTEYAKFSDCVMYQCNTACINAGGNNVFSGCTFHGVKGFVIDNSNNDKRNCAHGTCTACTFNHIDNQNRPSTLGGGKAVEIKGITNGFIFTGCQIWYGSINVENSRGVQFSDCLIGGNTPAITVSGNYGAWFESCVFHAAPALTLNVKTAFDNCYVDSTGEIVSPDPVRDYLADAVDSGSKNKFTVNSGSNTPPTRWYDIPVVLPAGTYTVSFGTLTTTDTDVGFCQATFFNGSTQVAEWAMFYPSDLQPFTFTVTGETTIFRLYASNSYAHSEGDTVTFTNAMCCRSIDYRISPKYVPYSS